MSLYLKGRQNIVFSTGSIVNPTVNSAHSRSFYRAILEIGIYEIVYSEDIPPIVSINEAVEIAKIFGADGTPKFVNGVLGSVMEEVKETL